MTTSRRTFLLEVLGTGGGLAAAALLRGCAPGVDAAPLADSAAPVDGKVSVEVARYPELAQEGGAIAVRVPGQKTPILLVHPSAERFAAFAYLCPHAGCPLGFSGGDIVCPCHASRFDLSGAVLNPPARQALQTYPVRFNATSGDLVIDLAAGDADMPPYSGGEVIFALADYPQLAQPGGSVVGAPAGLGRPILVVALVAGGYAALDATCTHLACVVAFSAEHGQIECPCHGSTFTTSGAVSHGPAAAPLSAYAVVSDGMSIVVSIP